MARLLILAYGNPMRSDDGLAWHAADKLEGKYSPSEVEILRVHQLAPELAENVSRSEAVIFVDAAPAGGPNGHPGEVRYAEIALPQGAPRFSHQLSPAAIMALASQLYGVTARAFAVTLTGDCFDHGEGLSAVVAAAIPALVARIEERIRSLLASQAFPVDSAKP